MTNLQKQFRILGSVMLYGYNQCIFLRDLYVNGRADLVDFEGFGWVKPEKKDLSDSKTWSTYEKCMVITATYDTAHKIKVQINVYDGDNFTGSRQGLRWSAVFSILISNLNKFENSINYSWKTFLENQYEAEQQEARNKRIQEISKNLLK